MTESSEFLNKIMEFWRANPKDAPVMLQSDVAKRLEEARNGKALTQEDTNIIVQKQIQSALMSILDTQKMILDVAQRVDRLERK